MVCARCWSPADLEWAWGAQWAAAPPCQAGGHRYRSGGSTDTSDVPQHAGRLPARLASRSRGCQPLSRILAIFGVFYAKIHNEGKRLHRLDLPGTAGSPWGARMSRPPKTAFGSHPTPRGPCPASAPAPSPSVPALALPSPNPSPNHFHHAQLLASPHSRVPPQLTHPISPNVNLPS